MNKIAKINHKLMLMLLFPIAALTFFSLKNIFLDLSLHDEHQLMQKLSQLAVHTSALVHEQQKERGMTAGYIGSKGKKFTDALPKQRDLVDQRRRDLENFLQQHQAALAAEATSEQFIQELESIKQKLAERTQVRRSVDSLNIPLASALGHYTKTNAHLLNLISAIANLSQDGDITAMAAAYVAFLQSKERAGIERAVLSNTFAQNRFGPGMLNKLQTLINQQDTYMASFNSLASSGAKRFVSSTLQGDAIDEVLRMRKVAFDNATEGNFGIDSVYWFNTITKKINLLKAVEDHLSDQLIQHCKVKLDAAKQGLISSIVINVVTLLATLFIAVWVSRGISRSIGSLHQTIEQMDKEHDLS